MYRGLIRIPAQDVRRNICDDGPTHPDQRWRRNDKTFAARPGNKNIGIVRDGRRAGRLMTNANKMPRLPRSLPTPRGTFYSPLATPWLMSNSFCTVNVIILLLQRTRTYEFTDSTDYTIFRLNGFVYDSRDNDGRRVYRLRYSYTTTRRPYLARVFSTRQ